MQTYFSGFDAYIMGHPNGKITAIVATKIYTIWHVPDTFGLDSKLPSISQFREVSQKSKPSFQAVQVLHNSLAGCGGLGIRNYSKFLGVKKHFEKFSIRWCLEDLIANTKSHTSVFCALNRLKGAHFKREIFTLFCLGQKKHEIYAFKMRPLYIFLSAIPCARRHTCIIFPIMISYAAVNCIYSLTVQRVYRSFDWLSPRAIFCVICLLIGMIFLIYVIEFVIETINQKKLRRLGYSQFVNLQ